MHIKSLIIGMVIGTVTASGAFLLFSPEIRDTAADATEDLGAQVEKVGQRIENAGRKLR